MRKVLLILATALCLTACSEDSQDEILYSNLYGFGDVSGSRISIRGDGLIFDVTKDQTDGG